MFSDSGSTGPQARMFRGCRFQLFLHHNYQVSSNIERKIDTFYFMICNNVFPYLTKYIMFSDSGSTGPQARMFRGCRFQLFLHHNYQVSSNIERKLDTFYFMLCNNVFPFLIISVHGRIPCNWVSKYRVHLVIHQCLCDMLIMFSRTEQLGHSLPYILHWNL